MKFEDKNLIVFIEDNCFQFDTIDELVEKVFGKEYEKKDENDKLMERYEKIYPYALLNKKNILINKKSKFEDGKLIKIEEADYKNSLKIDTDINFFLSLCKIDKIRILEKKNANIFAIGINKDKIDGNYIIINVFADELLYGRI